MAEIDGVGNMATTGSDQCRKVVAASVRKRQRGREDGSAKFHKLVLGVLLEQGASNPQ
jgi:hypothetical protein